MGGAGSVYPASWCLCGFGRAVPPPHTHTLTEVLRLQLGRPGAGSTPTHVMLKWAGRVGSLLLPPSLPLPLPELSQEAAWGEGGELGETREEGCLPPTLGKGPSPPRGPRERCKEKEAPALGGRRGSLGGGQASAVEMPPPASWEGLQGLGRGWPGAALSAGEEAAAEADLS